LCNLQSPSCLTLSPSFTPQLDPGVSWFCSLYFDHGLALSYNFPPPVVLFWIICVWIKYCTFFLFLPPTLLMWVFLRVSLSHLLEFLLSWNISYQSCTGTMLLRLFTTHTLPCINSILGQQTFFWILDPWRWVQ
jgi:hypothetical protein